MWSLYKEDCIETMHRMDEGLIDLVVTSPPYDSLRSYNGFSFDFETVAKELYRTTKLGGVVVWVVGDATVKGTETGTSFKQVLYFKEIGFNIHDTMIYHRLAMPNSAHRYSQDFEFMFVLSKGKPKTFNPLQEDCKYAGIGTSPTSRDRYGNLTSRGRRIIKDTKKRSNIWFYTAGHSKSTKDAIAHKHPAIYPEQLARDHILSWSNVGDLVYDPFTGSGTTGKVALQESRDFIGSEISEEYAILTRERIASVV